jgi:hypothetical protein
MRRLFLYCLFLPLARFGYAQTVPLEYSRLSRTFMRPNKDSAQKERMLNVYANRKYSYGFSENFYGFARNTTIFHAIDGIFSDRFKPPEARASNLIRGSGCMRDSTTNG